MLCDVRDGRFDSLSTLFCLVSCYPRNKSISTSKMCPRAQIFMRQVEVGKPLCIIDGDEAEVVKAKIKAQQEEKAANAPPPKVCS